MIKPHYALILSLFLCTSCNYISYSQAIPLLDKAIFGVDDIELTQELIDSKQYSFVKIKLGKSAVAILTLRSTENGVFEWISSSGERIFTHNGKIIKTEGLPFNTYFYSYEDFNFLKISSGMKLNYDIGLLNPQAFIQQTALINISSNTSNSIFLEESVTTDGFRWKFKNTYSYDKNTGLPSTSQQNIHPKLDTLELTFIYK
jgi:hypothetical protein